MASFDRGVTIFKVILLSSCVVMQVKCPVEDS